MRKYVCVRPAQNGRSFRIKACRKGESRTVGTPSSTIALQTRRGASCASRDKRPATSAHARRARDEKGTPQCPPQNGERCVVGSVDASQLVANPLAGGCLPLDRMLVLNQFHHMQSYGIGGPTMPANGRAMTNNKPMCSNKGRRPTAIACLDQGGYSLQHQFSLQSCRAPTDIRLLVFLGQYARLDRWRPLSRTAHRAVLAFSGLRHPLLAKAVLDCLGADRAKVHPQPCTWRDRLSFAASSPPKNITNAPIHHIAVFKMWPPSNALQLRQEMFSVCDRR